MISDEQWSSVIYLDCDPNLYYRASLDHCFLLYVPKWCL